MYIVTQLGVAKGSRKERRKRKEQRKMKERRERQGKKWRKTVSTKNHKRRC